MELAADDWEVFDYLDDLLGDRGLTFEFMTEEFREGRRLYVMHFAADVARVQLESVLSDVPVGLLEQLWRLNNR